VHNYLDIRTELLVRLAVLLATIVLNVRSVRTERVSEPKRSSRRLRR
jgi:hypothetical protein